MATFREGPLEPPIMLRPHSNQDFSCMLAMVHGVVVPVEICVSTPARQRCRHSLSTSKVKRHLYLPFAPHNSFLRVELGQKANSKTHSQQQKLQQRVAQPKTFPRCLTKITYAWSFDRKLLATPCDSVSFSLSESNKDVMDVSRADD